MEVYYVFNAVWMYKEFCVWHPLIISTLMLVVVAGAATIVATYFRLNEESYEWQWTAFAAPFGIAYYLFAYGIYFYCSVYEYDGVLQLVEFVLTSAGIAVAVGLICAFVGVSSGLIFVKMIYRNLKTD
jgi:transmembrane 9 superfamily protein 2/4